MSPRFGIAAALTRAWVRLYTMRMPADLRDDRRAEIDADLWDHQDHEREAGTPPVIIEMDILLRALRGVPDDVSWRFEAIQARRAASPDRRLPMMALSARHVRWMGLVGVLGGVLYARNALTVPNTNLTNVATSLLLIVGLVAIYVQQRDQAGRVAKAGFIVLFSALLAGSVWNAIHIAYDSGVVGEAAMHVAEFAAAFSVLLLPPGFLLIGFGLKGPNRRVPLVIGLVFLARVLLVPVVSLLPAVPPAAARIFSIRADSPAGVTVFVLVGVGLALMGFSVFRHGTPAPAVSADNQAREEPVS